MESKDIELFKSEKQPENKKLEKKEKKKKKEKLAFSLTKKGKHISHFTNLLRICIIPPFFLLSPIRYYGNKKIKDGSLIYVCNHYTMFDALYIAATTWEGIHYIAKRENFEAPVIGWGLRRIKGISANRDGNDVRAVLDSLKCLKAGEKIAIFPEGTRNKAENDELLPFYHGAAMMAIKTKTPILPMVIYKKPRLFRTTHILLGEPFELTKYYDKKLTPEEAIKADDEIRGVMIALRQQHKAYLEEKKNAKKKK